MYDYHNFCLILFCLLQKRYFWCLNIFSFNIANLIKSIISSSKTLTL